jgi:hypothetical protein
MKYQYPEGPVTYQNSEPLNYLQNFSGIQQISVEKAELIKASCKQADHAPGVDEPAFLDKEEDDSMGSFFYMQSFTLDDRD